MRSRITINLVAVVGANVLITGVLLVPAAAAANRPDGGFAAPEVLTLAAERGIGLSNPRRTIDAHRRAAELVEPLRASLGPAAFGGLWIGEDDRIKIGIVAGTADSVSVRNLSRSHGLDGMTDVVTVRHSASALDAASAWLEARLDRTDRGASSPLQAAQSPSANAVELLLPRHGGLTAAQRRLVADSRARFGSLLRIGHEATRPTAEVCSIQRCDPPLRGGIRTVGGQACSLGFIARGRSAGHTYAMTAGHCIGSSWSVTQTDGSQRHIGNVTAERFGRNGDAAIIHVEDPRAWNPRPWVYVTSSRNTTYDPQYTINADGKSVQGMRVCMTGATSATRCGRVTRLNITVTYEGMGVRVRHLDETSYCSRGGDSGGHVYSGHTAYGIHTAGHRGNGSCRSYFQRIRAAEDFLNVDVIFG